MFRELDEEFTRLIATAAALIGAAFVVWDCMTGGIIPAAAHLALALGAFTMIRLVMGRSLGPGRRAASADDTDED